MGERDDGGFAEALRRLAAYRAEHAQWIATKYPHLAEVTLHGDLDPERTTREVFFAILALHGATDPDKTFRELVAQVVAGL
jgi:hypothetical protein